MITLESIENTLKNEVMLGTTTGELGSADLMYIPFDQTFIFKKNRKIIRIVKASNKKGVDSLIKEYNEESDRIFPIHSRKHR